MVYEYDNLEGGGMLLMLFTVKNTVVPLVLFYKAFWLFAAIHISCWCLFRFEYIDATMFEGIFAFSMADMKVVSAMTIFFEVFYTGHSYQRYLHLHHWVNETFQACNRYTFSLMAMTYAKDPRYTWMAGRLIRLFLITFFLDLTGTEITSDRWAQLVQAKLLRPQERELLSHLPFAARNVKIFQWIARTHDEAFQATDQKNAPAMAGVMNRLLASEESYRNLLEIHRMPVPFQYFHLLHVMVCLNVACLCWGLAQDPSAFAPLVFFVATFIFIGMLELAKQLADPFGEDEVDFPISLWLERFCENQVLCFAHAAESTTFNMQDALNFEKGETVSQVGLAAIPEIMRKDVTAPKPMLTVASPSPREVTPRPISANYSQLNSST